ncbi:MAG: terminase family protein [Christensenellaceae bacterium]|nr:terminase family protein [Christensenellaceae bacterium]
MNAAAVKDLLRQARQKELEYCSDDLIYFIENYVRIEDKDYPGVSIPFKLWPKQKEAALSIYEHKYNVIMKARQLGLSWLVLAIAAHIMMFTEGATVIGLSRTEDEAKELVRRIGTIFEAMEEFVTTVSSDEKYKVEPVALSVKLKKPNGKTSVFKAFASSPSAARSFTANLIIFDEWAFQERAEEIWTSGFPTVNRPTGGKVIGLSTIQLGGLFEKIWRESELFNKVFLPWDTDPRRDKKWYNETLKALGELIKQEYPSTPEEALTAPGGCFFAEFRHSIHAVEPFEIPGHWRKYHAIDYGLDMLASLWGAVDPEGNMYIYREVYKSDLIISAAAEAMKAAEGREEIYQRLCPPDLFGRSKETGRTRAEAFAGKGLMFTQASADRAAGWSNLHEWLRVYTDAEGRETAKLKIFKNCENLLRTLPVIQRDKKKPNDCAVDPHELTHAPDALRYMLMARPTAEPVKVRGELREYDEFEEILNYGF